MTRVALLLVILAFPTNHAGLERPATEADLLRGFAFGRCLGKAYAGTPFAVDADRAAGAYQEMGSSGGDAYATLTKEAEIAGVPNPNGGAVHNDEGKANDADHLAIFRCLEFYESAKLKRLAKKVR